MAQYYLMNINSQSVALNLATASATPTAATLSTTVAKSTTTIVSYITQENIPSSTAWGTQTISITLSITTASSSVSIAITPKRVNASGTVQQTGTISSFSTVSATGNLTITAPSFAFTAGSATDRLAVDVSVQNTGPSSKTVAWEVNTVNSYITSPIVEWNGSTPGTVVASAQYAKDRRTPVAIGATTGTDGNTTPLWLETDVSSKAPAYATTASTEAKTVGTSFANTADVTTTSESLRERNLPSSRRGANINYDSVNKRYISIGGYDGTNRFNDLWELSANGTSSRFHLLTPTGTAPPQKNLGGSVMLCTSTKAWFIYWGGANTSGAGVNDMAIADCSVRGSESWTTITQTNTPSARDYLTFHMFARPTGATTFDVYLWGGWQQTGGRINDMYKASFDLSGAVPTAVTWTTISQTNAPSSRSGTCIIYDSANDRAIMFGGYDSTTYLNDLYAFNFSTNTWTTITPTGTLPAGREMPACGYDVLQQRMIVFGGWQGSPSNTFNDIISIGLTAGSETIATIRANDYNNNALYPFTEAAACVDTDRNIIVEFGQYGIDNTNEYVYAFDLNDTSTSNAPIYGLNVIDDFRGRDAPGYCVDTTRNRAMLVNGFSRMADDQTIVYGDHHNETWSYDWTNNALRYGNAGYLGTPYREGVLAVYDSVGDRVLQFGGLTGQSVTSNEIWELKPDIYGNYKARLMHPGGTIPGSRWLMAGAYDATRNRVIVWCGANGSVLLANTDMWQLDLSSGDGTWSSLSPTGTAPPAVWQPMYAYDGTNRKLYVAAGATNYAGSSFSTRLDVLDLSSATPAWSNLATTGITGVRGGMMGIDVTNQYLWAFGGYNNSVVNNNLYAFNLAGSSWTTVTAAGPEARRSGGAHFVNGKFYVSCGRPVTGQFYSNVWELTPNYTTLNSSTWVNKVPTIYQRRSMKITGKSNGNYHWQSAANIGGTATSWASFGNNTESSTDFTVGTGGGGYNVRLSSMLPFFRP